MPSFAIGLDLIRGFEQGAVDVDFADTDLVHFAAHRTSKVEGFRPRGLQALGIGFDAGRNTPLKSWDK